MDRRLTIAAATTSAVAAGILALAVRRRRRLDHQLTAAVHAGPERDLQGYGPEPPDAGWPHGAQVAINFVINVEEGAEPALLDGDGSSSAALCECGSEAPPGVRDLAAEGMFEYGSRCGIWRVLAAFQSRGMPATVFACALALERLPRLADAIRNSNFDVCCHGWRWEDHIAMDASVERARIAKATESLTKSLGAPPQGWYCRTAPSVNTRRLLVQHGGFLYDSDCYNDDLPYWVRVPAEKCAEGSVWHLVVPYTLCTNDSKFAPGRAFSTSATFASFMQDALHVLLEEARTTGRPKMMSVGLHPRLIGHPARFRGLQQFLDHVKSLKDQVWVCRRIDIARHWCAVHPPPSDAAMVPRGPSSRAGKDGPRLLVTGGAGFVLSNLVHHWLCTDLTATAVIFDQVRAWDQDVRHFLGEFLSSGHLEFFDGDIASPASWQALEARHGSLFTHVVSGAAMTPTADEEGASAAAILAVNVHGHLQCLEWARLRCTRLRRFIHVSSDAVLSVPGFVKQAPLDRHAEDDELAVPDMSLYALSKVAGEAAVQRWRKLYDLDAVSVRFSDVYGRLDRDTGARNRHNAPYWVCRKALLQEREPGCHQIRVGATSLDELGWDLIDVESAARGLAAILRASLTRRSLYHIAFGRCVTHRELVEAALESPVVEAPSPTSRVQLVRAPECSAGNAAGMLGHVDVQTLAPDHWLRSRPIDVTPMKAEFGWEPTPLKDAVAKYMKWLRLHS